MKNLITFLFLLTAGISFGQVSSQPLPQNTLQEPPKKALPIRINLYANYAFDDKFDSYYSNTDYLNGKIKGGFQWGGGLEYMIHSQQGIELSYLRLDTEAPITYYDLIEKTASLDVASNYLMLGSTRYFGSHPVVEPYSGVQLGMGIINFTNPENGKSDGDVKFSWGVKAGLNIWAAPKVAIVVQAGLLSLVQALSGGVYFGTGGISTGVSSNSSFYQFNLGGGLAYKLGGQ